jgi:hypothetical protein
MLEAKSPGAIEPAPSCLRLMARFRLAPDYLAAALERHPYFFLGLASLGYFSVTVFRAQRRLFWFDEIFTYYIARLPDLHSIWEACRQGADFNPPLLYLLTRWSQGLFGINELGTRMPEIIGFWVFCLCLYRFVSLRFDALAGFIGLLLPLTMSGYWYASDARSHGLVLGFFGLALISWQAAATRQPHQWKPVAGLAASLSAAALCHCYVFLFFIPFGIAELTRNLLRRRIDAAVWVALALPAMVSVITVVPLLAALRRTITHMIDLTDPNPFSGWELSFQPGQTLALVLLLPAVAVLPRASSFLLTWKPVGSNRTFAWHEIAMLAGILCTPFFAFLVAHIFRTPLYARYSLVVTAGFACLLGAAFTRSRAIGIFVVLITLLFIANNTKRSATEPASRTIVGRRPASYGLGLRLMQASVQNGDPIVLLDVLEFAPIFHYAPVAIRSRLVYLIPDQNGELYSRLQNCCGAPGAVTSRPEFLAAHRTFLAYGLLVAPAYQTGWLRQLGARISYVAWDNLHCLLRVELPTAQSASTAAPTIEKGR